MTISDELDRLADLMTQRDLLVMSKSETEKGAMPPEVVEALNAIDAEFDPQIDAANKKVTELEEAVKKAIVDLGETFNGSILQGVYMPGRVTWDTKGLDGVVALIPEVAKFRKVGNGYAVIKRR